MDYEKKYKEALEKASQLCAYPTIKPFISDLQDLFPELKESEDERIRKALRERIIRYDPNNEILIKEEGISQSQFLAWLEKQKRFFSDYEESELRRGLLWHLKDLRNIEETKGLPIKAKATYDDWISWLEKQDRQKSDNVQESDNVEPKFKVGDWCIDNEDGTIFQIVKVLGNTYTYKTNEGKEYSCTHYSLENDARLWTIQDAKDGDILCTYESDEPKIVFILKGIAKKHYALDYYCYYNIVYPHFELDSEKGCLSPSNKDVRPATKEQRDLLFQKMKDAGYEWHADEKELYLNWKPSEKQLKTLERWLSVHRYDEVSRYDWPIFDRLYKDLKKLVNL